LEERRNVGESSYNSGDGTDQRVQSLMFMMMMMMMTYYVKCTAQETLTHLTETGFRVRGPILLCVPSLELEARKHFSESSVYTRSMFL